MTPPARGAGRRLLCVFQHATTRGAPGLGYRHRLYLSELVRRGWHVDLVSTPVNYMTGTIPEPYAGRLLTTEDIDGVLHHWVWALPRIHRSRLRRAFNYISFAGTSTLRAATLPRPDVILASSPPLPVATVGALLAARFRRRWVLEIRDPWPDGAVAAGWLTADTSAYRLLGRISRHYESTADAVLLLTPGLVRDVEASGARRVEVVTGIVPDRPLDEATRAQVRGELDAGERCVFMYVGAHGVANGLDAVLDAARQVPPETALFVLVGEGSDRERLRRRAERDELPHVVMLGAVSRERVDDYLAASDVCLHMLRPDPLFAYALPNKILSYFEAHRPFLTNVPGLPERLATESGGAFCASSDELASELLRWAAMPPQERGERGEKAFRYGRLHFEFEANADRLERLLNDLVLRDGAT